MFQTNEEHYLDLCDAYDAHLDECQDCYDLSEIRTLTTHRGYEWLCCECSIGHDLYLQLRETRHMAMQFPSEF